MRYKKILNSKKGAVYLGIMLAVFGNLAGITMSIFQYRQDQKGNSYSLERKEYGQGGYEEELYVREAGKTEKKKIKVYVEERNYSPKVAKELLKKAEEELEKRITGANEKLSEIHYPLNLPTVLEDSPVQLSWSTDNPQVLDWEGNIGEAAGKEGTKVTLWCELYLGEETLQWKKEITVFSPEKTQEEILQQKIQEEIEKGENLSLKQVLLPEQVNGKTLHYSRPGGKEGIWLGFLCTLIGMLMPFLYREREKQRQETKRIQMQLDYPDVITKLLLFLKAGLTLRSAVEKIVKDYLQMNRKYGGGVRYVYEELTVAYREMEGGMPEIKAYERFGERCGVSEYKMLSVLLIQNMKKGNQEMIGILEREAASAMEGRKRQAKIRGEQVSAKLLVPMLLQLMVVLSILLIPAFMSFYS